MTELERSRLYDKCLGALVGGVIGDALGEPSEGKSPAEIEARFGTVRSSWCAGSGAGNHEPV